jgi:exodeoxyribonuclease-3
MARLTLLSWNVNGVRAAQRKGFLEWFTKTQPDILGIQETKAQTEQVSRELYSPEGYNAYWSSAERKGYAGTAVFSKRLPDKVEYDLGEERFAGEGRLIILHFPEFVFFNVYVPNGGAENYRVPYKLEYCDRMLEAAEGFRKQGRGVVICGDINTAHREIDIARPKANENHTGFLPEERAWLDKFTGHGYIDTFRHFYPDQREAYTWWNQRFGARERNVGWRLDYFFVTPDLLDNLKSAFILSDVMGSDHCPVGIELGF